MERNRLVPKYFHLHYMGDFPFPLEIIYQILPILLTFGILREKKTLNKEKQNLFKTNKLKTKNIKKTFLE